jgi:hypothetical protein
VQNLKAKGRKTKLLHCTRKSANTQEGIFVIGPGEYRFGNGKA